MPPRNRTPPGQPPCHNRRPLKLAQLNFHPQSFERPFPALSVRLQDPPGNRELYNFPRRPEAQHAFERCSTSAAGRAHTVRK